MLTNKLIERPIITIEDYLEHFKGFNSLNLEKEISFDFEWDFRQPSNKITPMIQLAKPKDAKKIVDLFLNTYLGMYPYREVQSIDEMRNMIKDPSYHWFLFKIKPNIFVGCFGVHLEFEKKKAFYFGFIIKENYRRFIDSVRAFAGSLYVLYKIYKENILIWYSETRTAHNTSQYAENLCGLIPIAFFPNKDIFFNKTESDFMHIIFNKKVLKQNRNKNEPKIIRQVLNCYVYSNSLYHLGTPIIENPEIKFNSIKLKKIKENLYKKIKIKKHSYRSIKLSLKDSNSYFKFLYNFGNKSVEKAIYKVRNLEELFIFLQTVKEYINELKIRYFEIFVSAYNPLHQKTFLNAGFKPTGYIPCWNYKKRNDTFEDNIIFCHYSGNIKWNFETIPETRMLIKALKFESFEQELIKSIIK